MNPRLVQLLVHWVVMALGVTLATKLVDGISCDSTATLIVVVLLLSFFNAIIKPLLVLFTLPFIVLTLGLGVVVINALLFMFVGRLVDGFHVAGFWPAVWGALVVSVTNLILSGFTRKAAVPRKEAPPEGAPPVRAPRVRKTPDDVIDI
ncbi:MAG: phage holin family protein [Opitutaceae bacterium]|nr:phage holin family protein [Opitutaceae bacterium]